MALHAALRAVRRMAGRPEARVPPAKARSPAAAHAIMPRVDAAARVMAAVMAAGHAITPAAVAEAVVVEAAAAQAKSAVLPVRVVVLAATPRPQRPPTRWNATPAKNASPKCSPVPA